MKQQNPHYGAACFNAVLTVMRDTYRRKNTDYGDSFRETMDEYGLTALSIRLTDKLNRLKSLHKNARQEVQGESIVDTLLDIANYAVMGAMYVAPSYADDEGGTASTIMRIANDSAQKLADLDSFCKTLHKEEEDCQEDYPEDTQQEQFQTLQNMATYITGMDIDLIPQDDVEHVEAEPVDADTIDSQFLYDYQQLCAFMQNPTEEGLASAYEVAKRVMDSETPGGGDRGFINYVITLAMEVVKAYEGRQENGVVVQFPR